MTEKTIDHGHQSLTGLAKVYRDLQLANASEADTRAKVIDSFLKGVLYWREDDVSREERASEDGTTNFIDYVMRTANTLVLVEAKKAGAAFVLPNQRQSGKLGGWLSEGAVGEAIRQARDYCRRRHIPFAVVTNGSAWIVFPAVRVDGISFEETQARVFRSISDIEDRFVEFWELLSRQRVVEGNLENELLNKPPETESHRIISTLREPGFRLGRNALFDHIEGAVSVALSDEAILADPAALEVCYVKTSERMRFDKRLSMYLSDTKPALERPAVRVRTRKSMDVTQKSLVGAPPAIQKFILLLGPVGAGKSTFLGYVRNVSSRDLISGRLLWLQIDFKRATASDSPRQFIYNELLNQIESDLQFNLGDWEHSIRPAYREDIAKLERGVLRPLKEADPKAFEQKISEMILEDRKKVEPYVEKILQKAVQQYSGYLVVDNVDQLETDEVQNRTFVETQAIARRLGISVLMSLRDATYLRHRNTPTFNAFQVETLFIDPPSVVPVLSRRFSYAQRILRGCSARIQTDSGKTVVVDDLAAFFDIVSQSVLSQDAGFMLEILSAGDIRRGLLLTREFLASGHTNADLALQSYIANKSYIFPSHEIFKGAVLGARKYYREEESLLLNLLDSKLARRNTTLLRFHLTSYLVTLASEPSFEGVRFDQIADWMHTLGVPHSDIRKVGDDLIMGRILRTADGLDLSDQSILLPTRLGAYLVKELCSTFQYLELCAIDANIYDDETFDDLTALTRRIERTGDMSLRINFRLQRSLKYLEYLKIVEEGWIVECKRKAIPDLFARAAIAESVLPAFRDIEAPRVKGSSEKRLRRNREQRSTVQ